MHSKQDIQAKKSFSSLQKQMTQSDLLALHPRFFKAVHQFLNAERTYNALFVQMLRPVEELDYLISILKNFGFESLSQHIDLDNDPRAEKICTYQRAIDKNFSYSEILPAYSAFYSSISQSEHEWIGHIYEDVDGPFLKFGRLQLAHGGILLISVKLLLESPRIADALLRILFCKSESWSEVVDKRAEKGLPSILFPKLPLDVRVLLMGKEQEFDALTSRNRLWGKSLQTQLEPWACAKYSEQKELWLRQLYRHALEKIPNLEFFSTELQNYLLWEGARDYEHQERLSFSFEQIIQAFETTLNLQFKHTAAKKQKQINLKVLKSVLRKQTFFKNFYAKEAYQSYRSGVITFSFKGNKIGQANGLLVNAGYYHGIDIGMPFRLTCVKYPSSAFELIDIDGKVGFGGTIYQKGQAIMHACLCSIFKMPAHFPFSFSFVSEQCYDHFDGDSGTLAGMCCLISAITDWPISQAFAMTGSLDQFGKIQPIGGVSAKIEGFFELTRQFELDDHAPCPAVIFPKINAPELILSSKIYDAITAKTFALYPVTTLSEALTLVFNRSYKEIELRLEQIFALENERDKKKEDAPVPSTLWEKICTFFYFKK